MRKSLFACCTTLGICLGWHSQLCGQPLSLGISNSSNQLTVFWPSWASDAVLEQSATALSWAQVPSVFYQSNSSTFSYTTGLTNTSRMFRLRHAGPPVPGLSGVWSLDEGSGTTSMELTGSSNALFTTNTAWAAGRFGPGSLRFNGLMPQFGGSLAWVSNTAYAVLPPTGSGFSVSFWFCPDTLPTGSQSLAGNDADGSAGWDLALDSPAPGTNYLVLTGTGIGTSLSITGRTLLLPEQWRHVVLTYGNSQASVFLDDVLLAQTAGTLANNPGPLYFGGVSGASGAFGGRIDEIRTYTNSLLADDISLKGCWHLDEDSGYLAYDSSLQGIVAGLSANSAWTSGKSGSGLDLAASSLFIPNQDYRVLPPSGSPFSVSFWLRPRSFSPGRSALLSCASGANAGWQATLFSDGANQQLEFTSTNFGGTLSLSAPVNLPVDTWSEIDLTFNGVMANAFVNGLKVGGALGAIRAARAPLLVGNAPGASTNADAIIDELRVYGRERADFELGPVAQPMWEMALLNSSTNLMLPASGPPGRPLTISILSNPSRGTLTWSANSPSVTYTAGGQKGPDTFVYAVSDGVFTSTPATAAVSVVQAHWLSTNGGTELPLDGSSPDHAWAAPNAAAIDAIWHTNNYYDCFCYGPGEFQTTGWQFMQRATGNVGCKHIGSGPEGPNATTLKLVNTWSAWAEGVIFGGLWAGQTVDDFEVRNMLLDCNAQNNPKYAIGEPVSIRIPLTSTAYVQQVTLHWANSVLGNAGWHLGPAADFQLCSRVQYSGSILTNCTSVSSTGLVDVVDVQTNTDELTLWLTRKGVGIDFYALSEVEVTGAQVSLPSALTTNGTVSRLDAAHSILNAVDQDPGTCWASGPEDQVTITLPLEPGTLLTGLVLNWNCKTMTDLHRFGPAAQFSVLAREPGTGQDVSVPFVSHGRSANGSEVITFGTSQTTNAIVTAEVTIFLTAKVPGVDYYSLSEVSFLSGDYPVGMRLPSASSSFAWNGHPVFSAFDGEPTTLWVNSTQGAVSAIQLGGSNLKFTDLKIIGFGTKAMRECFVLMALSTSPFSPARNLLVENCVVTQPATNNTDGVGAINLVGVPGAMKNGIVRNCVVDSLSPTFPFSHGIAAPLIEGCVVKDVQNAFYSEPDPANVDAIEPVVLRSNVFMNVSSGISVFAHAGAHFDTIIAIGNDISLVRGGYGAAGCDVCSPGVSGTITNVAALGNVIRYSDWNARPTDAGGGFLYSDIHHAVYANNVIALGTPNALRVRSYPGGTIPGEAPVEDCDHPGLTNPGPPGTPPSVDPLLPGYRRAWLNNRDLTGALLPVRYTYFGVDGPASQQQWSEELP
jgi:hypothetical protein